MKDLSELEDGKNESGRGKGWKGKREMEGPFGNSVSAAADETCPFLSAPMKSYQIPIGRVKFNLKLFIKKKYTYELLQQKTIHTLSCFELQSRG